MPSKPASTDRETDASGKLRTRAEERLGAAPPDPSAMPVEDARALAYELQVHQAELDVQNEELRFAQVELAESRDRFSDLFEFAPAGYLTLDADGKIAEANLAAAVLLGVNRGELVGGPLEPFIVPDCRDAFHLYRRDVFAVGEKRICELDMHRRDRSRLTIRLESIAHGIRPGRRCRVALIDITELRRAEATLKEANERLRREHQFSERLVETAPSLIVVIDPECRVLRFNPAFERLSGWSLPDAIGLDWVETFFPESQRKRIRSLFKRAIRGLRIRGNVSPVLAGDGEVRQIEWFDAPLEGDAGELIGLLLSGNDVTRRIQLEHEVFRASEVEQKRIAVDLHDSLGSRLTGIGYRASGLSRKLREGQAVEPEEAETILEQVRDAIVQVRALSRGLQPVRDEPEALAEALDELARWVESSSPLNAEFDGADGDAIVLDSIAANHLYRIAREAATNAMRHSGATGLMIRLRRDGKRIVLSVRDDGSGFDPISDARGNGIGLHTMEYRARAIGAELTIRRRDRGGTAVECVVTEGPPPTRQTAG